MGKFSRTRNAKLLSAIVAMPQAPICMTRDATSLAGPTLLTKDGGCFGAKLVVVGSGPSRAGEGALAPGAYLDVAHVGEDADQAGEPWPPPLPNWSPRPAARHCRADTKECA